MKDKALVITMAILVLLLSFSFGGLVGNQRAEAQNIPLVNYWERMYQAESNKPPIVTTVIKELPPIIKTEFIEKEVPHYIFNEKIVEVPVLELNEFSSLEEARKWINDNKLDSILYFSEPDSTGKQTLDLDGYKTNPKYDCDDYAGNFQRRAFEAGYNIWQVPVYCGKIWGRTVTMTADGYAYHIGNMTRIGNGYYYIESSPGAANQWVLQLVAYAD
ncbi:hypothetical protein M0R04_08255 [Candidatus Dojkabacteria bacterium]|jgi:hypothetical protein|nr:hypothetical protein [Candidatus Dojkabacteria bacterium]